MINHFFVLNPRICTFLLIGIFVASCSSHDMRKNVGKVYIKTAATEILEVEEPKPATVTIYRDYDNASIRVRLLAEGEAKLGVDYLVEGAELVNDNSMIVTLAQGQSSVDLVVTVLDDVAAEAEETLRITLEKSSQYNITRKYKHIEISVPQNDFVVTNINDSGEGSLHQAMLNANSFKGRNTPVITFDSETGAFGPPQTIFLESKLPPITNNLIIDGFIDDKLWQASGVVIHGNNKHRVFSVLEQTNVTIKNLTVTNGYATEGGGILNKGSLVISGVTFMSNHAKKLGGGLLNVGEKLFLFNSTFTKNSAKKFGGGLANNTWAEVTNVTFSENTSRVGGGIWSNEYLHLGNSIVANSRKGKDCVVIGSLSETSSHNLIESHKGCGKPIVESDPKLDPLGYFNGPTQTFPLGSGSPAIHLGNNDIAIDENDKPFRWDQRGNGDPRFVAGYVDIGSFEYQAFPSLVVDTTEDSILRACTPPGKEDCPLRGAIELAIASKEPTQIKFDPQIFSQPRTIELKSPLPLITGSFTIDATGSEEITVIAAESGQIFNFSDSADINIIGIDFKKD